MIVLLRLCCSQLASSLRLTVDPLILDIFLIEVGLDFDAVGTVVCSNYPVAHDQKYETNIDILFVWSMWERISENKIYMGNSFIYSALSMIVSVACLSWTTLNVRMALRALHDHRDDCPLDYRPFFLLF